MDMQDTYKHKTVLLDEAINSLNIKPNGIFIDCTFGRGGHTRNILAQIGKKGRLYAMDCDPHAIIEANKIIDPRFSIIYARFSFLDHYAKTLQLNGKVNGILLDLGVSSPQLDNAARGFSFMNDGPLDMRMDINHGISAAEWLLKAKETDIEFVLKTFGEERFAKRIARAIIQRRHKRPITRTVELANLICDVIPIKNKFKHPATRSFQALRIWTNNELEEIKQVLQETLSILAPEGRLVVISFHSLEDRIVKRFMREQSRLPQIPCGIPINEIQRNNLGNVQLKLLGKIIPSENEVNQNPRCRSAVLRLAERTIK